MLSPSTVKQLQKMIWACAAATCAAALYVHLTHRPTAVELAESAQGYMANRDASGLAKMIPQEELDGIGIDRPRAAEIIDALVLPNVHAFTTDVTGLSKMGNGVAFEKPPGAKDHDHPPELCLSVTGQHRYAVTLASLLDTVWGERRSEITVQGGTDQDWSKSLDRDFAKLRSLGYTKSFDWNHHDAINLPDHAPSFARN